MKFSSPVLTVLPVSDESAFFMDKSSTPQKNVVKMERAEAVETKEVNFLSFNCKNIKTIGTFLHHHRSKIDILLLRIVSLNFPL
jgi:hypothetical protein